ncbi:hypothetical protein ABZ370_35055 [Streptomyces sp. NPDC005962]|uniref:hypothetical protein n=1 Tax=Streptomyces sp. NPDC005962 TaxID=3154466 RepID=UPI0033DEB6A6
MGLLDGDHLSVDHLPCLLLQGVGEGLLQMPLLNALLARIDEDNICWRRLRTALC